MKRPARRGVRRYNGEDGSVVEGSDDSDIAAARMRRIMEDKANQDALDQKIADVSDDQSSSYTPSITLGNRPSYQEGVDYTIAPSPVRRVTRQAPPVDANQLRNLEAAVSRGRPAQGINQIPGQSLTDAQRQALAQGDRIDSTELGRNLSNTLAALTPLGGGVGKIGTELAFANRAAKAAQMANVPEKLSAAGQRLKNLEELRNIAYPGRAEAVMNPSAWAGGPNAMEKIAQVEARAAQAQARAARAQAANEAKAARANAKDPVMQIRPGGNKPSYQYEGDAPMDINWGYKRGGKIKKSAKVVSVSSASKRADGIASRGKTRGKMR